MPENTPTLNQYVKGLNLGGTEQFTIWVEDAHGASPHKRSPSVWAKSAPLQAAPATPIQPSLGTLQRA